MRGDWLPHPGVMATWVALAVAVRSGRINPGQSFGLNPIRRGEETKIEKQNDWGLAVRGTFAGAALDVLR